MTSLSRRLNLITIDQPLNGGWLGSRGADLLRTVGSAALAILAVALVSTRPELEPAAFILVAWLAAWLLVTTLSAAVAQGGGGVHPEGHFLFTLPALAALGLVALGIGAGTRFLFAAFVLWFPAQCAWQSWGVARAYQRKAYRRTPAGSAATQAAFYLLPLWGVLRHMGDSKPVFVGVPAPLPSVPSLVADIVGLAAIASILWWGWTRLRMWEESALPLAPTLFAASHFTVFTVALFAVGDAGRGWLMIAVWWLVLHALLQWRMSGAGRSPRGLEGFLQRPHNAGIFALAGLGAAWGITRMAPTEAYLPAVATALAVLTIYFLIIDLRIGKLRSDDHRRILDPV